VNARLAVRRSAAGLLLAFAALSLVWTVVKEVRARRAAGGDDRVAGAELTVYYFHATARCPTCNRIEELTRSVVQTEFAAELASGRVEFRVLNREEPSRAALVERYSLATNAVVLARGAPSTEWKDLKRIWDLVGDEPAFRKYISSEVSAMLGGK
jgi:hypothetical protein